MQATANQVRWVPIEEIIDPEGPMQEDGPVQLCRRPDGLYTLLSGRGSLRRMRQAGQLCVDAVLDPTEQTRQRLSALLDKLVRGSIHYLDEAEAYRQYLSSGEGDIQDLAAHIGRTPATIRKKLRLNNLGEEVARELRAEGLPCPENVTACRRYGKAVAAGPSGPIDRHMSDPAVRSMVDGLAELLARLPEKEQQPTVPYQKWADARREADRLRVEVDLLKMALEDQNRQE